MRRLFSRGTRGSSKQSVKHSHMPAAEGTFPVVAKSNGQSQRHILITGGAGFIGTNLADRFMSMGARVLVYDNLSRRGSAINLEWLAAKHPSLLQAEIRDVRDADAVRAAVKDADAVFHFAAQVAVTGSILDPRKDFEVNVGGTLNILEAIRELSVRPPLLFTSTNKVYGVMADLKLAKNGNGYRPLFADTVFPGITEERALEFCSPYGCSKGAADQYVLDYARTFGLPAAVFRMSCIYGPHQFGTEDQGWVAHFAICTRGGKPITIYGDGLQVRDILFVDDLVEAFLLAKEHAASVRAHAFNVGGGSANALNLLQLAKLLGDLRGLHPELRFQGWRCGDQRYYVSDIGSFHKLTGWMPRTNVRKGVAALCQWLEQSQTQNSGESHRKGGRPVEFVGGMARWAASEAAARVG